MKVFENDLTQTIDAIRANVKQKQALIDKLIGENAELLAACKMAAAYCSLPFNQIDGAKAQAVVNACRAAIQKAGERP